MRPQLESRAPETIAKSLLCKVRDPFLAAFVNDLAHRFTLLLILFTRQGPRNDDKKDSEWAIASYDVKCTNIQPWCPVYQSLDMISTISATRYGVNCFSLQLRLQMFRSLPIFSHISIPSYDVKGFSLYLWCQVLQLLSASVSSYGSKCADLQLCFQLLLSLATFSSV